MERKMDTITRETVKSAYSWNLTDFLPQSRSYMCGYLAALTDMNLMSCDEEERIRECIARRIPVLTDEYIYSDSWMEHED